MCNSAYGLFAYEVNAFMAVNDKSRKEYYTIDLLHIFSSVWKRIWVVVICGILGGIIGFSYATFDISPTYSSEILLYVNNSSLSIGSASFSISSSEITAAQSLVKTYIGMLENRTTLETVIEKSGVDYTWQELDDMIDASSLNETEILKVKVTSTDPYDAAKIANCIAEVLPQRISEIIEGSSMEVVDSAVVNLKKVAPSITRYAVMGGVLGVLMSVIVLIIMVISDDTIHDEEYILQNYKYPILAKVPDLHIPEAKGYAYYKKNSH